MAFKRVLALIYVMHTVSAKLSGPPPFNGVTSGTADESWGYVTVRPQAHMFWWLYETTHSSGYENRPLLLWLQGGPGASGVGYGNFDEIGPLDVNLNPRETTWLQTASLLFIDNPVGTGYSYVDDDSALCTDGSQISDDLLVLMQAFVEIRPEFQTIPFYIFSESYGGKMTAEFSLVLFEAIQANEINMNFLGFVMGDAWIAPADTTLSWGPFLYSTSLIDDSSLSQIMDSAQKCADFVNEGLLLNATEEWRVCERLVTRKSGGVNFYNILAWDTVYSDDSLNFHSEKSESPIDGASRQLLSPFQSDALTKLMNGAVREKLQIIPDNVTWQMSSYLVFDTLAGDFMREVTSTVNELINTTPLKVVTYQGQLDLICATLGAEKWFSKLDIAESFSSVDRELKPCTGYPTACYYSKKLENVEFYWVLNAGHMVPVDNGYGALDIVNEIIG